MTSPQDQTGAAEYRRNLLLYPNEQPNVDYKSAVRFDNRDPFTFKLVKHIIALANSGGGTIVIGYKEDDDKKPVADPNMTSDVCSTYDHTELSKLVNNSVRGLRQIKLDLHKESSSEGGQVYPIITVHPFEKTPFFSSVDRQDEKDKFILKQGALYVRSSESATVEVANPDDWERLMDLALEIRQADLLSRFSSLMRQFGLIPQGGDNEHFEKLKTAFAAWVLAKRKYAIENAISGNRELTGTYSFAYRPLKQLNISEMVLVETIEAAKRHNTGWPIGLIPRSFRNPSDRLSQIPDGIEVFIGLNDTSHFDYWSLDVTGSFFIIRLLGEDDSGKYQGRYDAGTALMFSTTIWRIAEALDHCIALYTSLALEKQEVILFEAQYYGIMGRMLVDQEWPFVNRGPSSRNELIYSKIATLDELIADADGIVFEAVQKIFYSFNFYKVEKAAVHRHLSEYRKSRV